MALRNNGITGNKQAFVAKLIDEGATSHFAWVHSIGTGEAGGSALAVQGTAVFVTGSYYGTLAFPGISLPNVSRPDLGTSDMYLLKLVDEGNGARMAWVQRAGGSMDDDPRAIALVGKNVYVAGAYNSPSSYFGPATLLNAMPSTDDAFVAKLTDAGTQGEFVWARSAGGVFHDRFYALAVKETSVYVAGFFGTTVNLGPFVARNAGNLDMVVAKLTDTGSTGEFTWVQTAGGPGYEEAQALALQGNTLYVTGEVSSPEAAFGKHVLQHDLGANVFVTKLTDLGQASAFDWVQQGGGEGNSEVNTIAVCRSQIYVGGFLPSPGHFGSLQIQNGSSVFAAFLSSLTDSLSLAATTAALTNGLEIFPNPAHAALWVRVPPLVNNQPVSLTILDATGRIVRRQTQGTASQLGLAEVDLMGIATGVYLLRVQAGEIMASQRFVIQ
ncbi:T9SS type A sorting domain-containing protein [Hymenobacter sp. 5414T-23]|uniref:T9SS type A sorting domain-containing protein n=1 Tax=Hymenobacter sp. 5414T-23 TaxID=2932252 RepID=UPI001FD53584|nr:T9SS type A sorting domain-containing protein [Hymenobacter sp. 5414T-23]UOQ81002.1 T9SS type A sorting domain-containing protein [Hymenobacter sp. 5414T-23]